MACDWWYNEVEHLRSDQFFDFEQPDEVQSSFQHDLIQAGLCMNGVDPNSEDAFYLHSEEYECCTNDGLQNNPTLAELNGPIIDDWDALDPSDKQHRHSVNAGQSTLNMIVGCRLDSDKHGPDSGLFAPLLAVSDAGTETVSRTVGSPSSVFATMTQTVSDDYLTSERKAQTIVSSADGLKGRSLNPFFSAQKKQQVEIKLEPVSQSAPGYAMSSTLEDESGSAEEEIPCKKLKIEPEGVRVVYLILCLFCIVQ
jgi:hypothetical protein